MVRTHSRVRFRFVLFALAASLLLSAFTFPAKARERERRTLLLGGELVGIEIETRGVLIVGTDGFLSDGTEVRPAQSAGMKKGDTLLRLDGREIETNEDLSRAIAGSGGRTLTATVERDGREETLYLTPKRSDGSGAYQCGLWVRDCAAGVGTLTYTDPASGTAAALGHGIYDVDTGQAVEAAGGTVTAATFSYLRPGTAGTPGELGGKANGTTLGRVTKNGDNGVFAQTEGTPTREERIETAFADEVTTGDAEIVCTVSDGAPARYGVRIEKIRSKTGTKNLVLRVTDPSLLALTGGIVQGMSGSPIVQNGRLVGAVTHVFLNDPKCGYGILIENMTE